jgi:hypothetical protein
MSMLVFWAVTPCGLVSRNHHFGGTYCLHLQPRSPEGRVSMFPWNVGVYLQVHTALQPRRSTWSASRSLVGEGDWDTVIQLGASLVVRWLRPVGWRPRAPPCGGCLCVMSARWHTYWSPLRRWHKTTGSNALLQLTNRILRSFLAAQTSRCS